MLCRVFLGMGSYNGIILIMATVFFSLMIVGYLHNGSFKETQEWTSWLFLMMAAMEVLIQFKNFQKERTGSCFTGVIVYERGIRQ